MGNKKEAKAPIQNEVVAPVKNDAIVNFDITVRTSTTGDGHKSFSYKETTKDGEIVLKTVYEPALVSIFEKVDYLTQVSDASRKALCIELSRIDLESLKKAGIKGGFNGFVTKCFGLKLDTNTAGRYRRIGKVFGTMLDGHYAWKEPISADVSVTNLGQVLSLVNLPKNWEELTEREVDSIFKDFLEKYIFTGKISLDVTLKELRRQIKDVANMIDSVATEIESDDSVESDNSVATEIESDDSVESDNLVEYVDALMIHFKGNERALELLAELADLLK